ncbi:uncharacterized protein LOC130553038 [Triplophysa rosa]|uniref:uncharacterized protein LOC130553038 n=1 Tax=Triplophysa rosa TaxID=992332 RepID=UPI00254610CF|nr:uncharacterized protein LOC130553038 [Triplophysa rosa]
MFPVTSLNQVSGSAEVTSRLVFNTSSPVPSEDLVLKAINDLRNKRESNISDSVKLTNVTYEKISETSYAVIFTFTLSNISMPEDPELRNSTSKQVQDMINDVLNTLLNDPDSKKIEPTSSNFSSASDKINANVDYTFQDSDEKRPVSFLNELRSLMGLTTTTVPPQASVFPVTSVLETSGSAVVTSRLVFNSSSPVPSEDLVLSAFTTLRNTRESQLNDTVKVVNVTFEKVSDTSYALIITFSLSNISIPQNPELRNYTFNQVKNTVNNALNTLLNDPTSAVLQPKTSDFTSTSDQINGMINYTIQDGDAIQPVSFLSLLRLPIGSTTTVSPLTTNMFPVTSLNQVSGSAVVTSRLVFNSSPVPSEDLVLSAFTTLRNSRESQLNDTVKVVNVTYEKISDTSYVLVITFALSNISIPVIPELRNNTFSQVQNIANNALNTLLNEPTSAVLQPKTSDFTSTSDQINGMINYTIQDGDAIQPVSFLSLLRLPIGSTTTVSPLTTSMIPVTSLNQVSGSAVVTSRLVFNSSPVPSEDLVLSAFTTLRNSRESQLNDTVKVVNVTYEKISDTSYVLVITFALSNISIPVIPELRNNTFSQVQNIANNALNTLLNEPTSAVLQPKTSDLTSTSDQIHGNTDYTFQDGDAIQPVSFLNLLQLPMGLTTINTLTASTTVPPIVLGTAIIYIKLVFITVGPAPNESSVLQIANSLLDAKLRTSRAVQSQPLKDPVSFMNITYKRIAENQYSITFGFEIGNVSMSENFKFRNDTHTIIQDKINGLLSKILNDPSAAQFKFPANFTGNSTVIQADVQYVFREGDINAPSLFIQELLKANGVITTPAPATTFYPTVVNTSGPNNSTSAAWVVAIIVPCAIAIMLVPCWILLCCLLCGCCARIRRRWHRRQSYNVQYTTRHSLF